MGAQLIGHAMPGAYILALSVWWMFRIGPELKKRGSKNDKSEDSELSFQYSACLIRVKSSQFPIPSVLIQLLVK
jgi:hypothetical protein